MGFLYAGRFAFFVVMVEEVVSICWKTELFSLLQTDADIVRGSYINPKEHRDHTLTASKTSALNLDFKNVTAPSGPGKPFSLQSFLRNASTVLKGS